MAEACVGAIILAAGASTRMGRPKQTLTYRGESLLRRAAHAALDAGCWPVVVVTGAHAEISKRELEGLEVTEAFNPDWETGMASSVRAGVEGLVSADAEVAAAVVMLCDQPHVDAEIISSVIAAHRATGRPIVASSYGGSCGVPALFAATHFPELTQLEGESGAKRVIERHAAEAHLLSFRGGEIDVDTPDDLARLESLYATKKHKKLK